MKATIKLDMPKVISEAIAEQAFKRTDLSQSLALLNALFYLCEYGSYGKFGQDGYSYSEIQFEADMAAASALAHAADYFYLDIERGSYKNYLILLGELMHCNVRIRDAIIEFKTKLKLGEFESFDYSEISLSVLDKLS